MQSLKALLRKDLELTRSRWSKALGALRGRPTIDESLYEELEEQLLQADVGTAATTELVKRLRQAQRDKKIATGDALAEELKAVLTGLLAPLEKPFPERLPKPFVILLAGVNGAGKTTPISRSSSSRRASRCCSRRATPFARRPWSNWPSGAVATT